MSQSQDQNAHEEPRLTPAAWSTDEFERFYDGLHARIYNLAARVLDDRDEAADVTQEVFLRAYGTMPIPLPDDEARRWMYRVTVNACCDLLRRRRTRPTAPLHDLAEVPAHCDLVERAQMTRAVETALADLSPRYRTALVLKDLHGLDNGEVADIMGMGRGATGVVIFRARAAFRRAFSKVSPSTGLGLVAHLPMLPVPAALQTPPALGAPPIIGPTPAAVPAADGTTWAGPALAHTAPAAADALGKIGTALTAKLALLALGASVIAGGGLVLQADGEEAGGADVAQESAALVAADADRAGAGGRRSVDDPARHRLRVAAEHQLGGGRAGDFGRGSRSAGEQGSGPGGDGAGEGVHSAEAHQAGGAAPGQSSTGAGGDGGPRSSTSGSSGRQSAGGATGEAAGAAGAGSSPTSGGTTGAAQHP